MSDWTFHGGRLSAAMAAYGGTAAEWIDLSTGINPDPWPDADAVTIDWRNLPDGPALAALEAAAAGFFGVDPAHICALPGTEIGLRLLGTVLPDAQAHHLTPSYRTHGEMVSGSRPVAANAWQGVADGLLILANPNNPDGRIIDPAALGEQVVRMRAGGGWLVVDEAFADADPAQSMAGAVGDDAPLILFRSFGKFFGLAGVRIGFVLGPRAIIAAYRARLGAWPLSAAAIAIGTAAYRDTAWIGAARDRLVRDSAALDAVLRRHGFAPVGGCPLFRLIDAGDGQALFERLARRRILTRPFDYAPGWLRLGLPADDAALARLDRALGDG